MKTKLMIEIETPDDFALIRERGEEYTHTDGKEFAEDWHSALVNHISNMEAYTYYEPIDELEDYYSIDGELPEMSIRIKVLKGERE